MKLISKPIDFISVAGLKAMKMVGGGLRRLVGDTYANALQAVAYGTFSALITAGICIYILNALLEMMNLSEGDMLYEAIAAIPGGVVTLIGVIILTCFIANISVALAIFSTSMPGGGAAGGRY